MNQEYVECLLRHAKADFLIEGLRKVLGFPFESFELLPGWIDGASFYGQSHRIDHLTVCIGIDRSRVAREDKILITMDDLIVMECPVRGEFLSPSDQGYICNIL